MAKMTIHFLYTGGHEDDVLTVTQDAVHTEMFRVVFRPGDSNGARYQTFMSERRVANHISNILRGVRDDADPIENIQITTSIQPAILYHVSQLDDDQVLEQIEDSVFAFLRHRIHAIHTPATTE